MKNRAKKVCLKLRNRVNVKRISYKKTSFIYMYSQSKDNYNLTILRGKNRVKWIKNRVKVKIALKKVAY